MYHRPRIIPTLLLDDGMMVKTTRFQKPRYIGDIVNAVRIFNNKGVDELCILDISATSNSRTPNFELLHDIATEAFMPLSYGGGICCIEQVTKLFRSGFEKLLFNTALIKNPHLVKEAVAFAGSQSIAASIDVKKGPFGRSRCYIEDGKTKVDMTAAQMAEYAEKLGVGEILLTSIDHEGMMDGYDIELVKSVARNVGIPVIANGGAGSMFVFYGKNKAVLITALKEEEMIRAGIYKEEK